MNDNIYISCDECIIGGNLIDFESTADLEERARILKRKREEDRLQHMAEMHSIEEKQEERAKQNAEDKADLKKKKEEADIEAVNKSISSFCNIHNINYLCDGFDRNGKVLSLISRTKRSFRNKSKQNKML